MGIPRLSARFLFEKGSGRLLGRILRKSILLSKISLSKTRMSLLSSMLVPFLLQLPFPSSHHISSVSIIRTSMLRLPLENRFGILISSLKRSVRQPFFGDLLRPNVSPVAIDL